MLLKIEQLPQTKDCIIKDGYVVTQYGYGYRLSIGDFFRQECSEVFTLTQDIRCVIGLDDQYSYITVELTDQDTKLLTYTVLYPEHDVYCELSQQKPNVVDRVRELVPDLDAITKLFFGEK